MKCDELKDKWFNAYPEIMGIEGTEPTKCYGKADVDEAIAELKAKLEDVQASAYAESVDAGMENRRLKDEIKRLENVRKVHIKGIESMSEGLKLDAKQICKTQRALWLTRADRAKAIQWHEGLDRYLQERKAYWPSRFCFMANDEMYHVWYKCWCEVERKCRAKAKEYE